MTSGALPVVAMTEEAGEDGDAAVVTLGLLVAAVETTAPVGALVTFCSLFSFSSLFLGSILEEDSFWTSAVWAVSSWPFVCSAPFVEAISSDFEVFAALKYKRKTIS